MVFDYLEDLWSSPEKTEVSLPLYQPLFLFLSHYTLYLSPSHPRGELCYNITTPSPSVGHSVKPPFPALNVLPELGPRDIETLSSCHIVSRNSPL